MAASCDPAIYYSYDAVLRRRFEAAGITAPPHVQRPALEPREVDDFRRWLWTLPLERRMTLLTRGLRPPPLLPSHASAPTPPPTPSPPPPSPALSRDDDNTTRRADSPPLRLELEDEGEQAEADAVAAAEAYAASSRDILLQCQLYFADRQQKAELRPRRAAKKRKIASMEQREWPIKKPPRLPRHPGIPLFAVLFPVDPPRQRPQAQPRQRPQPPPLRPQPRRRQQPPLRPPPMMPDDDGDELCLFSI